LEFCLSFLIPFAYFEFIPSDQVDFATLDLPECIRLSKAATTCGLSRLQQMCDKYLQEKLTMENIFDMIKFSDGQNVETAKNVCLEYALLNNKQFIMDSRVSELDVKLFQWVRLVHIYLNMGFGINGV